MKALLINSSNRVGGNTATVLAAFAREFTAAGVAVAELNLARQDVKTCRGCRICFDMGEAACPLKDDVLAIKAVIDSADLVVFASPVYVEDVSGSMKNLIDRLAFVCHRPAFFGKRAYVVCTSGVGSSDHAPATIQRAASLWGFALTGKAKFVMGARMPAGDFETAYAGRVRTAVERLRRDMARPLRPSLIALLTFNVQQRCYRKDTDTTSADHRYWRDQGWLDKKRYFYIDAPAGRVKRDAARLLGAVVERVVLG